jgi:hypothetical protein
MEKARKALSTLLVALICVTALSVTAFADNVDVFDGRYGDWFGFFNNLYMKNKSPVARNAGYDVDFSATVLNKEKNSVPLRIEPADNSYDYFTVYNFAIGPNGVGNRMMDICLSRDDPYVNAIQNSTAVKVGESVSLVPYLTVTRNGTPLEYKDGREYMMLSELSYLPFIRQCTSKNVLAFDDYCYDFIEYHSSDPSVLSVTSINQSNSGFELKANKSGIADLVLTCTYQYKYKDYDVHDEFNDAYYKALFPSLCEDTYLKHDHDYYCAFRYEIAYRFVVYDENKNADIYFDDTNIGSLNSLFEDCDLTAAANESIKFKAEIDGLRYSAAIRSDCIKISGSTAYIPKTGHNTAVQFVSTATKVYDVSIGGQKKRIKVISGLGSYDKFRLRFEAALNSYLEDDPCFIRVGDQYCVYDYLSAAMNDVAGADGVYGLPLFPKNKRPIIDSYDKSILSISEFGMIKPLKETPETVVKVCIGDSLLNVTVSTVNAPGDIFIVPMAAVSSYTELKQMPKEKIEEYALTDGYTLYQDTSMDVYIFTYPRFNADISAEISSGSTIATISPKDDTPHGFIISTAKTDNRFTVKAWDKDDNSKSFNFRIMYINSVELDPSSIEITYNMADTLKDDFAHINSFDDIDAAYEAAMSSATLSDTAFNKSCNKSVSLYVNGKKYLGDVYYIIERDTNGCVEMSNCRKYTGTSGIASDIFTSGSGNANLKISYSTKRMSVEEIIIHAFLKPPKASSTLSQMFDEPHASCKISIMPGDKDEENTGKMQFAVNTDGFEYPFADTLPFRDAQGNVLYYYGCELKARNYIVYVGLFETENVLMSYKEYAYIPFAVRKFDNGTVTLSDGKRVNFAFDSRVQALSVNDIGICDPDSGSLYDKNSAITSFGINDLAADDLDSTGYAFYVWLKCDLPYTVSGASLKSCSLSYTGGKAYYTCQDGKKYTSSEVRFAVLEGGEAVNIEGFAENDGKIYVYGTTSANASRRTEYVGQRIIIAVNEEKRVFCPESVYPTAISSDETVASCCIAAPNNFRYEHEKAAFSVDITGENEGKETVVTVYGNCSSECRIKVVVVDDDDDDTRSDSRITKHYTLNGELGGKKYHFDYSLTVPKTITVKAGETIRIPYEVKMTGNDPLRSSEAEPNSTVAITMDSSAKSYFEVKAENGSITLSGIRKGKTGFTIWGYDKHIHVDVEVCVE